MEWDNGVGYTWSGIHIRSGIHTEWSTHRVEYTQSEVHIEWGVRYIRSWVYTD